MEFGRISPHPYGEAGPGRRFVEKERKEDERTEYLRLAFGGTPIIGIKLWDVFQKRVEIKVQQFRAFLIIQVKGILGVDI